MNDPTAGGDERRPGPSVDPVTGGRGGPWPPIVSPPSWFPAATRRRPPRWRSSARARAAAPTSWSSSWTTSAGVTSACYGGGVAVGAPTPNVDRLARDGLLLTSCYSEPSCTPTRASIMTGRLPMRHGLLVPPMYGMPGGLQRGGHAPRSCSRTSGYVTQAVGKWHMGENSESQPQNVGFDDFYGFLSVSDMYTEWRDPYFFPEVVYSEDRTEWVQQHAVQQVLRARDARRRARRRSRRSPCPCSPCSTTSGAATPRQFIERMAGGGGPLVPLPLHPGARTSTTIRTPTSSVAPRPGIPTRTPSSSWTTSAAGWSAALERTGQLESTMVVISSDNGPEMETWPDSAFTPFRCAKGSTWEGGVRVPAVVSWPGMIEPGRAQRRPRAPPRPLRHLPDHGGGGRPRAGRPLHRRASTSCPSSWPADDREVVSNRKYQHYWLTVDVLGTAGGRVQVHARSSISDDDTDVLNPGGFTGVVQRYGYGRLYNLYLDPKETRSYMIRKLVYIDAIISEVARHQRDLPRVAEQAGSAPASAAERLSSGRARRPPCAGPSGSPGGRCRPAGGPARARCDR